MDETTYTYHNEAFDFDEADDYTLLLQIGAASFSYAVVSNNRLLMWETNHPLAELLRPAELEDIFSATYKQVIVGLPATAFTLIPESLYSDEHLHDFARFLNVQDNERVFVQQLDSENRVIYKVNQQLADAAIPFGLENTVFAAKGWLKSISNNSVNTIYADIQTNRALFSYSTEGKLNYLNSFEFYNADELTYYAALVCEQVKLQPDNITLALSGDVDENDQYITRLAEFFKTVTLSQQQVIDLPAEVEPQHILSLSALILCG